jgi:plastocyanin
MTRRAILWCALLVAGSTATGATWAADAQVTVDNFTFSPPTLTVPAGTKVTWINHDDIPHKIVGRDDPAGLNSPVLDTDESFSQTFGKPGTYAYFCSLHPHMQGRIVVQ